MTLGITEVAALAAILGVAATATAVIAIVVILAAARMPAIVVVILVIPASALRGAGLAARILILFSCHEFSSWLIRQPGR
ncbi:hypothetical protein [Nitrospirillum pindoramense]|uniref:hypothetical protein n=1 Tax=Nitrospirillum amazonense TaxID=28077 RepID=UPI0011A4078F|nr:hypothetical protein [Nitrospirillum amazonense]